MKKIAHKTPNVFKASSICAVLIMFSSQLAANELVAFEDSETKLLEQDKKIAGKLHSTLYFESIKLESPSAIKIDKGVVSIDSDKLDGETVEKIKSISKQIHEVVTIVTKSSS